MKILSMFIIVTLLFSCKEESTAPKKTPSWNHSSTLPGNNTYRDIFFIEPDQGWLVAESDKIFHTKDSGVSWELQNSGSRVLFSVQFLDTQYGWATGHIATYYTINSGESWNYVEFVDYQIHVRPMTDKVLFIDRNNILVFSSNAGNSFTWVSRNIFDADSGKFSGVSWYSFSKYPSAITHRQYNVWVADIEQNIYLSTDGGINWSIQKITDNSSGNLSVINDIYFTDEKNGWLCSNASVYYSSDGGYNWECRATLPDSSLGRVFFFNNEGWLMGEKIIYYSSDGGNSWEEQFRPEGEEKLVSISFVNNSNGWALSEDGNVYHYGIE